MKLLKWLVAKFKAEIASDLSIVEESLIDDFYNRGDQWSVSEPNKGFLKAYHRGTGVWVLIQDGENGRVSSYNGHEFSLRFTHDFGAMAKVRVLQQQAKERERNSSAVLQSLEKMFVETDPANRVQ